MAILVSCAGCGKQFRAKDQFKSTKLKCPNCKSDVLVQGPHVCGTDVFISHSTADKQVADAVTAAMESKNLRCWIAPRDIPAGASWGSAIIEGIEDSRAMLLIFSQHANRSDQVLREVERAVAKKKPVVPLRIDREPMRKDFEYFLASCQWLDATDGALDDHLASLTRRVRHLLLDKAEADADVNEKPAPPVSLPSNERPAVIAERPPKRWGLVGGVAAALGVIAALIVYASRPAKRTVADAPLAAEPASSTRPAAAPGEIDLLARMKLPDDVVSGTWTRRPQGGVHVAGAAPGRANFGEPPPGDYDVRVAFTPLVGDDGLGVVVSRFGHNFAFALGMKTAPGYGFGFDGRGKVARLNRNFDLSAPRLLTNDVKHELIVKVRRQKATAILDGRRVSEIATRDDFGELSMPKPWAIGKNALGFVTFRSMIVHSAQYTPVTEGSDD